jgi:hypothetical protein
LIYIWNGQLKGLISTSLNNHIKNLKYIQTQLGHSSPTVTLNVYAHLLNPINQEAACRYENMVFENSGSKMVAENKKGATV